MAEVHHYLAGEGNLWVQLAGPNTDVEYLGCHQVGEITTPRGDITLIRCRDKRGPNQYRVVGSTQDAAGAITVTITTDLTEELDALERADCPFTIFVNMAKDGRRDLFTNFERSIVLRNARITSDSYSNSVARSDEDQGRAEISFDISAEDRLLPKAPTISRQNTTETQNINDISFCNTKTCRTSEDQAQDDCEVGYAVAAAAGGSAANVLYTSDGGSTWTATAADPFGNDEHIIAVECFEYDPDTTRAIVARGTTDIANPAEIAYSDDNGATWTTVNVGSTNGQYVVRQHALFAFDRSNIWMATDDGYIYKSTNGGLTWATQDAGTLNTGNWNAIHFADEDVGWIVGASNEVAKTITGGDSWESVTGPNAGVDLLSVFTIDRNFAWVGAADGTLWYTFDGGTTWTQRDFTGSGVGDVEDIKFFNDLLGFMAVDNASPVGRVLYTINGGADWVRLDLHTNAGYNALHVCNQWTFFVVGNVESATGYIAKGAV